jgi:SAM-dependent methyltransferase
MTDEHNAALWSRPFVVDYYESHRRTSGDVYSSEWIFLKDHLREGISILDVGCAHGGFAGIIAEHIRDFNYTGTDISETMIAKARARFPQHRFSAVRPGSESLPASESFDLVLCLGILHLHATWRDTICNAWKHTGKTLILDLRLTGNKTIEDKTISNFIMDPAMDRDQSVSGECLPYNIINIAQALNELMELCPGHKKIFGLFPVSPEAL